MKMVSFSSFVFSRLVSCLLTFQMSGQLFAQSAVLPEDALLFIMDVQPSFYGEELADDARQMINHINELVTQFDTSAVVYTQAAGKVLNISNKGISTSQLPPTPLDSTLQLVGRHLFIKTVGNAFESTDFSNFIRAQGKNNLILTGMMVEECLYQTAKGALKQGYEVWVLPEAVIGTTEGLTERFLKKMERKGVHLIPSV